MNQLQENPFSYFKDIQKIECSFGTKCQHHNDVYVSYCMDTQEPLCVKCILIYSNKNKNYEIVSLSELKNRLFNNLIGKQEFLKKNFEKIETVRLKKFDYKKVDSLKEKGLRKLGEIKDAIIQVIIQKIENMKRQWEEMFDENFNIQKKQDSILREINLLQKIHHKSLKDNQQLAKDSNPSFQELINIIETDSMIKSQDYITKKVNLFIKKLEKISEVQKYPELNVNTLILNQFFDMFQYLFDYNFDFSKDKLDKAKTFRFKLNDFFKGKIKQENQKNETNALVPIIAKNRRMMVYDINVQQFKELMLSEVHSIPQGNQIVLSKQYPSRYFIVGGHLFKNPQGKIFELDINSSDFISHNNMSVPRWLHQTIAYKNFIFVLGGTNNEKEQPISSVERFDIETQKWETLPKMNVSRHSFCAVLTENLEKDSLDKRPPTIYVFGGIGSNGRYVDKIEKFDIERNSWSILEQQKSYDYQSLGSYGLQINNNEILLFGGLKYLPVRETLIQDPNSNQDFILYPFNNTSVFLFNIENGTICCNNYYNLPFGAQNTGNQLIFHQKKIYFSGNLNQSSFYTNQGKAEFTDNINAQKFIGTVTNNKFDILDYILFQQLIQALIKFIKSFFKNVKKLILNLKRIQFLQ